MCISVPARKLLGLIVSHRGIELDPSKVKAIQELPPLKNMKDMMSFLGCLNYISRFIAQSTVICEPIFKILKKDTATNWTKDCQKSFDKIKEYLSTPPVLVPPEHGSRRMGDKKYQDTTIPVSCARTDEEHPDKNFIYPIPVKIHSQPTYCAYVEEETDGNPWFHDIKEYLVKGEYPE
ncbi:uncharacterized mitochondrial protein AtMg00860-like [Nicotiana sylvestris]|uniref:uncharacterized mitochondrial protein AtMg00860-like n=1 Tax=Nicotiana sylvestris TaxID=4096 RepID=UPI00388CECC2